MNMTAIQAASSSELVGPNHERDLPTTKNEEKEIQTDTTTMEEQAKLRSAFKDSVYGIVCHNFHHGNFSAHAYALPHQVFSRGIFTTLLIISFTWVFCNAFISPISSTRETAGFSKGSVMEVGSDLGTYVKQLFSLTSYEDYWDIRRSVQRWLIKNEQSLDVKQHEQPGQH
jgi:hypothetical protein